MENKYNKAYLESISAAAPATEQPAAAGEEVTKTKVTFVTDNPELVEALAGDFAEIIVVKGDEQGEQVKFTKEMFADLVTEPAEVEEEDGAEAVTTEEDECECTCDCEDGECTCGCKKEVTEEDEVEEEDQIEEEDEVEVTECDEEVTECDEEVTECGDEVEEEDEVEVTECDEEQVEEEQEVKECNSFESVLKSIRSKYIV